MIQDCINGKNFKEFTLEFKSQDQWQIKKLRVSEIRAYFELRHSNQYSVASSRAEAFVRAGDRV